MWKDEASTLKGNHHYYHLKIQFLLPYYVKKKTGPIIIYSLGKHFANTPRCSLCLFNMYKERSFVMKVYLRTSTKVCAFTDFVRAGGVLERRAIHK